jgi:hypothetical protein
MNANQKNQEPASAPQEGPKKITDSEFSKIVEEGKRKEMEDNERAFARKHNAWLKRDVARNLERARSRGMARDPYAAGAHEVELGQKRARAAKAFKEASDQAERNAVESNKYVQPAPVVK